ncbi:MAG: alpha/beta hydrolase [Myxococcales bacterium]|nr:alpha/beta hydrolase [Myxococcales bacterium]
MFVTLACWREWVDDFAARGRPGRDGTVAELRGRHPDPELGKLTLGAVVARYEAVPAGMRERPALVGHSMGGLIVQLLLQRGQGSCGVAIDSAPPKGVLSLKGSFLKSNWPVLNPFVGAGEPYLMPFEHFQYTFVHTLPLAEQRAAYEAPVVPESRRVGRGTTTDAAKTDFAKPRPPLLFIAGSDDRIIPAALNQKNRARYAKELVTDFEQFPGRTHYIIGQPRWREVAERVAGWIGKHAGP